ncbi:MAG: dTDP-4-dehydrorhamnose reductase, partial [Phototrophicales bacterium]
MRVIVIGAAGRLGSKLMSLLPASYETIGADVAGDTVEHIDVTDFVTTRAFITAQKPDIVIHTAAWTDVDGCAQEPEKALTINGYGTQNVAVATATCGAAMLYVSTNEVFDGTANRPYYEYDRTNPINPYGYSKVVGERALMSLNPRHYIVRTS